MNDTINPKLFGGADHAAHESRLMSPELLAHVAAGGQALELWPAWVTRLVAHAPACFRGRDFGKLYDADADRLGRTARRLGVRVVVIDRRGQPTQHVDLVGKPLAKAKAEAGVL